jgi:hypothetical protein
MVAVEEAYITSTKNFNLVLPTQQQWILAVSLKACASIPRRASVLRKN